MESKIADQGSSPDDSARGFVTAAPDPFRYDGHVFDPDEVAGIVASMVPAGARVLDVGCAAGSMDRLLAENCRAEVVGVEPDARRAELARSRGVEVHRGYLTRELIGEIGRFDLVLLADVLEHLPDPQAMLVLAREALKPGGAVIVSVPNVAHWSVRLCLLRGRFQYMEWGIMDATHLRWFTSDSVKSLITSSGYKIIQYRGTAGVWILDNYARAPLRWLPRSYRQRLLRLGCRHWPTLFASQHVLKAQAV